MYSVNTGGIQQLRETEILSVIDFLSELKQPGHGHMSALVWELALRSTLILLRNDSSLCLYN